MIFFYERPVGIFNRRNIPVHPTVLYLLNKGKKYLLDALDFFTLVRTLYRNVGKFHSTSLTYFFPFPALDCLKAASVLTIHKKQKKKSKQLNILRFRI
jgi:hypothetical protein